MTKHNYIQQEKDLMLQRAQQVARKHPMAGKTLIFKKLIREHRTKARREMKEFNQSRLDHLRR